MTFTRMDQSTAEQWQHIIVESIAHQPRVADRVLAMLASLEEITDGFEVDQLVHSLQTATRAEEAGASDEVVVASLCHDIGKAVSVMNHPRIAAEILRPYVSEDTYHMILAHQDFQGKHYYEYLGQDPERPGPVRRRALVRAGRAVRGRLGPDELRPGLPDQSAVALRALGPSGLLDASDVLIALGGATSSASIRTDPGRARRVIEESRREFDQHHPDVKLSPVVGLICAYDEEDNIGPVLAAMPTEACGLAVTTLVVVDGGTDKTDQVAKDSGAVTFVLSENLGHGYALRVGYALCIELDAQYVVTLDADGQNDPEEIPVMLQPLVDDEADFVVASRVLGRDTTTDRFRKAGVRVFSLVMSGMGRTKLTDTSNGYRALAREHARRRGAPPRPTPVPDGGAAHHRHEARVARHRTPHRLAAACVRDDQEGQELALRCALRTRRARDVVEGAQGASALLRRRGPLSTCRSSPWPRRRRPAVAA